ncbi:hypothetical protein BD560DRAFT_427315 [Blakeslea trispora]|nr:hypothetical protein BD560DRAFT_427315 [Blakeslea trispora]
MDSAVWEAIVKRSKEEKHMEAISDTDALWCVKINQAVRTSNDDAKEVLKSWMRSDDTDEACRYQDVYRNMLKAYSPCYDKCNVNEDTFVKDTLLPLLAAYFPKRFDYLHGRSLWSLFLVKCKPPRASPSDDFVKMANWLKNGVGHSALTGGSEIVPKDSHAILFIIGSRCKVFSMDLKYHGMCRLIEIGTFYLPRDHNDLDVMLGAFQVINQCQKIVMEAAKVCKETIRRDGNDGDMCLPSFGTPIRLPQDQIMALLQNVDPGRLARAARKLDFSKYFHEPIVEGAFSAVIFSTFTEHHLYCKNAKI